MNTVGAIKSRPFHTRCLDEQRQLVRMGAHKPRITIKYRTKANNEASVTHDPESNPMDNFLLARD